MSAFQWNKHPFYLDQYENKFITYFNIVTLSISSVLLAIAATVWIYQLFLKTDTPPTLAGEDAMKQSDASKDSSKRKKRAKIDMSLPTLTVAQKDGKSSEKSENSNKFTFENAIPVPEPSKTMSKTASDPKTPSGSNEPEKTEKSGTCTSPDSPRSRSTTQEKSATQKHREIDPLSKALVTVCIVLGMLFIWGLTAFCILCIIYRHPTCVILALIFEILYIQRICLYCYYFHRLYLTFERSVYAVNKKKLIIKVSILCCWWFCGCVFFFLWVAIIGDCTELDTLISIIPLGITETFTSGYCVYGFLHKIQQLHVTKKEVKQKLQDLTTKLAILASFTVLSTVVGVFCIYPFTFFLGLLAFDMPVNVACLMLTFGFYDKYYQMLCGPCRRCVDRWRMRKEHNENNTNTAAAD